MRLSYRIGKQSHMRGRLSAPVHGGSLFGQIKNTFSRKIQNPLANKFQGYRDSVHESQQKVQSMGRNVQSGADATIKRNLQTAKQVFQKAGVVANGNVKSFAGGAMMQSDPLDSIRMPKFVGKGGKSRNNIKLML
jgi:hypothetical protein